MLYSGKLTSRRFLWGSLTDPNDGENNACGWTDLASIVTAMRSGDTYINVQIVGHPTGEIRGQIELRVE
jgi:hypothetical protein